MRRTAHVAPDYCVEQVKQEPKIDAELLVAGQVPVCGVTLA